MVLQQGLTVPAACRSPAVKEDDDYEPPGQPEVVADIDFAEVCASAEGDGVAVPSWYQHEYGAELMHSQVCSWSLRVHCNPACPIPASSQPYLMVT